MQLSGNHAAVLALLFHHYHHTILISPDQQIVLNCKCPVGISGVTAILGQAIMVAARADYQFSVSPLVIPSRPSLRNLTFVPSGILTHLFTGYSPAAFGFATMIAPLIAQNSLPVSRHASLTAP